MLKALDEAQSGLQAGVPLRNLVLQQTADAVKSSLHQSQALHAVSNTHHSHSHNNENSNDDNNRTKMQKTCRNSSSPSQHHALKLERGISKTAAAQGRTPLSERAKELLERWFTDNVENPYPTMKQKEELARVCNMNMNSVNNWFGNKRMRIKRKMLNVEIGERGTGGGIGDKVLAPRSKWNAVVVSKMKSPEGRQVVANATGKGMEGMEGRDDGNAGGGGK